MFTYLTMMFRVLTEHSLRRRFNILMIHSRQTKLSHTRFSKHESSRTMLGKNSISRC